MSNNVDNSVTSDKEVKSPVVIEKKVKHFLFSDVEIKNMNKFCSSVVVARKAGVKLGRVDYLKWKILVASKVAQRQPYVLKFIGYNGDNCKICGKVIVWGACCSWMDRFWNNVEESFSEKQFTVNPVCEDCLKLMSVIYMHEAEWLNLILSSQDSAEFHSLGDAKAYTCALCTEHLTDSTWVFIPWNKMMLKVAVCNKHFDILTGAKKYDMSSMQLAGDMVKEGSLSNEVYSMLAAYAKPVQKKKGKKIRSRSEDDLVSAVVDIIKSSDEDIKDVLK